MKINELLRQGREELLKNDIEDASIIARILLEFVLKIKRNELIIRQEEIVEEKVVNEYKSNIEKIIDGMPLQYITNRKEFMKILFYVDKNVLIPQPDTEILVEEVLNLVKDKEQLKILDICTGSGCIGISLAYYLENSKLTLTDISKRALNVAIINAKKNKIEDKVEFLQSDMFEKIKGKYDFIVSNPPYIETDTIRTLDKQVQMEPIIALDGGKDGLFFYRKLVEEAPKYLEKGGYLCMEIGYNQKNEVISLLEESKKYKEIYSKKDLSKNDRIIIAKTMG